MDTKPAFNPDAPYEPVNVAGSAPEGTGKPAFDPSKEYESATPDGSEAKPFSTDIFHGAGNRAASSFGDETGIAELLHNLGYHDVKKTKAGETIAKAGDGTWYKDEGNFFGDQGSLLHKLVGGHPLNWLESHLGSMLPNAGMAVGAGAGAPAGLAGSAGGAALGAAGGESGRQLIGRILGTYAGGPGDAALDMAGEGSKGAAFELGAKPVGYLAKNVVAPLIAKGAEKATMGKLSAEDLMRLINRPQQMAAAEGPDAAGLARKQVQAELEGRRKTEGAAIGKAKQAFLDEHGETPVDTSEILKNLGIKPQESFSPSEVQGFSSPQQKLFTQVPEQRSSALAPQPNQLLSEAHYLPQSTPAAMAGAVRMLGEEGGASTPMETSLVNGIKSQFHQMSPEGLAPADAAYARYIAQKRALSPIEDSAKGEGWLQSLLNKGSLEEKEALSSLAPQSIEGVRDIAAQSALKGAPDAGANIANLVLHPSLKNAIGVATSPALATPTIFKAATNTSLGRAAAQQAAGGFGRMAGTSEAKADVPELSRSTTPLYHMEPDQLQTLAQGIATMHPDGSGKELASLLSQVATQSPQKQKALLFSIQQNPAYRQMLGGMQESGNDDTR